MAERKPIVLLSDNNLAELPAGDSLAWNLLSGVPVYATRWPTWEEVSGKPTTFTPAEHTHTIANVSGLQSALDGKAAASHTHSIAQVSGLQSALDGKAAASHTHGIADVTGLQTALDGKISSTEKGAANGVAPLGADSKIPATYLPSYVDDVLEYANQAAFPGTGATGIIYVALDTNKVYRWSGSAYVEISPSPGSTDAVPEGATNLYFTDARARAAVVQDTISDAVTDRAPSQNAVFDALAGKANTNHTHTIANVTGLQVALDGKAVYTPNASAATLHNNTTLPSGFYTTSAGLYGPDGTTLYASSWHHVINLRHNDGNGYAAQIAAAFGHIGGGNGLYFRSANGTTWSAWRKIWHEGNDGAGSGLDADLLDGQHASSFAQASHTHDLSALTQSGATTGQVPQWNGTAWVPSTVAGGGGGGLTWQTVAVNTTMASGNGYNANGALSMSLPLTISTGDRFAVHALGSTVTVLRNGNTITYKGTDVADDVTIAPGETIYLVATAADVLEIV